MDMNGTNHGGTGERRFWNLAQKPPQNAEETQRFRQHQRRETDLILGQDPSSEEVFHSETNLHC